MRPQLIPLMRRAHELRLSRDVARELLRTWTPYILCTSNSSGTRCAVLGASTRNSGGSGRRESRHSLCLHQSCLPGLARPVYHVRMVHLCQQPGADALHLDQTLCIYNDHNGRIDGMSMMEGNIALHQQLREALPDVALSGEGLNEITCRHEAFAQRHVWGIRSRQRNVRSQLARMPPSDQFLHPASLHGHLWLSGLRAARRRPSLRGVERGVSALGRHPHAQADAASFSRIRAVFPGSFWKNSVSGRQNRVDIDLDGPWPTEVAFPFRTADGRPFLAMRDRRWICNDKEDQPDHYRNDRRAR